MVVPSGSQFFSSTHSDRGCSLPIELDILLQAQRITVDSGCFGMLIGISLARIPQWQLMTVSLGDMMRYLSNWSFSPRPNSLESNKDLQLPQTTPTTFSRPYGAVLPFSVLVKFWANNQA